MLMTPGPTEVPESVRKAMSEPILNPDIEEGFMELYLEVSDKLQRIYGTDDPVHVLGGEGILGLESSIASTVKEGDDVLCLANGIFGKGFADFVRMYGGEPVVYEVPFDSGFDIEEVKRLLEEGDFKIATMVHCETPTGFLNDLDKIVRMLKEEGVLTIVDAVSSLGGTQVPTENMDICLGGSQKCFSSPPGLTTVSLSGDAWDAIDEKEQETFYTDLSMWRDVEEDGFPYTHLISNIYALDRSVERILEQGLEEVFGRHEESASLCREMGREMGLELYPEEEEYSSPTVTAFSVDGDAVDIQRRLKAEHDILIATGLGELKNDIIRIGHMGYNADVDKVRETMEGLGEILDG